MNDLYSNLIAYGICSATKLRIPHPDKFVSWTEENFTYVKYNPRKDINRFGLSITSLDGSLSGIPDLDSLPEYNKENNLQLHETDFNVSTPVYEYAGLKKILDPIKDHICRSHILKIGPGGYFPPHRDYRRNVFSAFRLLIPLQNMNPPSSVFIIEDKIQHWEEGTMYFVDTAKLHYLFNAGFSPSYMVVINAVLNSDTVNYVTTNLKYM